MTRADGIKWKKEINFWIDGGDLYKFDRDDNTWKRHTRGLNFTSVDLAYMVMADEHFESRKEFALGKRIQYKTSNGVWENIVEPKWYEGELYRVKPKDAVKMNMKDLCDHLGFEVEIVKD